MKKHKCEVLSDTKTGEGLDRKPWMDLCAFSSCCSHHCGRHADSHSWDTGIVFVFGLPIGLAQWIALRRIAPISFLWVLTISAGFVLAYVTILPMLEGILGFLDDESVLLFTLSYTSIGALVGMTQWLLLRAHFNRSMIWILANAAGLGLGIAIVLITDLIHQSGIASIILVTFAYAVTTGAVISWLSGSNRKSEGILFNNA